MDPDWVDFDPEEGPAVKGLRHTHTHTHTHAHTYTHTHTRTPARMHARTHAHTDTHMRAPVRVIREDPGARERTRLGLARVIRVRLSASAYPSLPIRV